MIKAWRGAWHAGTGGQTEPLFPFGFVQLSAWGNPQNPTPCEDVKGCSVSVVRFGQTANYGYVPNPAMPATFMATAVDLAAFEGGCGKDTFPASLCIHPGWKAAVGARLAEGAMAVGYGDASAYNTGPIFESAKMVGSSSVVIQFRAAGVAGIEVRTGAGFELLASNGTWVAAPVIQSSGDGATVTLQCAATEARAAPTQVRYLWSQSPCTHPHLEIGDCAVYAKAERLPATPFLGNVTI